MTPVIHWTREGWQVLAAALFRVESRSIRDWAVSEHNFPLWLTIASDWAAEGRDRTEDDISKLTIYVVCTAMGM